MDGDIYDKWGEHIDPRTPGEISQEALRRAAAGPSATPAMFRMWQEKGELAIKVEEIVGDSEEVTQRLKAGTIREEPIVIESDEEGQEGEGESAILLLGRMEDLLEKVGRYQRKLQALCEEAREWEANLLEVFLYDSGQEPSSGQQGCPRVATVGTGPRSSMTYRPPTSHGRVPQAARTRSQNKAGPSQQPSQAPSQAPPRKEPEPGRRKEVVEVPEEEEEDDDEEDERLRQEEDQRAELRAKKRGAQEEAEPSLPNSVPKRKKYAVRMEEGFDVERMVDKLLEDHNNLMNLKDILATAPRLRGELKGRLSRRLVPNVHLSTVLPREVEWTEAGTRMDWKCVACEQVDLVIRNQKCTGMVDTGAEMNIIREKEAVMIGMEIDRSDHGMLHGANCKAAFCGTASNDDGTMILLLCDPACGNYEVITYRNTGPGSGRNRPNLGSFTFEESENEWRRLWEVLEEEDRAEVLTLSLTDVNKAMEVVSTHDMADPEAIKALREQVLENPQRERGLIRRMREHALAGPCRINDENEGKLIIGEPDFLSPQERALMVGLMKKRHRAYAFNDDERGRLDVDKIPIIRIHTVPHEPWNLKGARYPNPDEEKMAVDYLDGKMRTHVADYSSGPYASLWFYFINPNVTLRWVQDLQRLNEVTVRDAGGLPNANALSESCAGMPIISLIDLYSGYDQFPVYPPDRPITAMHTPRGLIHMNVAPQGWTNAVAMVQRHMIRVMQTVSPHITQPYIDDLAVKGPKEKEENEVMPGVRRFVWKHVQDIDQVLGFLEEHNLTASGPKSKHCMRGATILGFVCNESGRRPDVKKTDKILEWPVPFRSITDVRSFLGTCGFRRSFVKDFATKTEHLRKLVRQDQEWVWGEDREEAVGRMKGEFKEGGLVLGAPNYEATEERPFVIETDAGPTALGGILIQADNEEKERPLRFESRTLNTTERNYSQFKKETLAVLHCLRTFRNYVFGRRLILRVDPTALACSLKNYTPSDPTVARWLTYIWMFYFELERIPGNKNKADGLSRIYWDGSDKESIEDTPPVDGFLDQEKDVRLHINEWSLRVPSCVSHPIWLAPKGYEQKEELVLKPFQEEDPWGSKDVGWMMKLALAGTHSLVEEVRTIEEGPTQVEEHEQLMGGMYLLTNTLLQGDFDRKGSFCHEENEILVPESRDDEFEEGEIKEAFRAEEYDGIYRELGLLLSCEMRDRDASAKAQKMRHLYVMLRASPMGPDGLPIRLEEGNAEEFILAYEQYMRDQGTGQEEWMQMLPLWTWRAERSLARQIRDRARDWEDCQTQLRQAFRRLEPERPEPRVERQQRKAAQAMEPVQAAGPARAVELPPTYGLEQVEFRRITGSDLRGPSPTIPEGGEAVSLRTPLDRLEAHLDASQWGASQLGADHSGPARYELIEDEPEEEPPEPGPKARSREPEELQTEGVITVGDDTPPPTPIPEQARQYWLEGILEPDSEEMLGPPPEATTPPPTQVEPEGGERARTPTTVAPQLTESTGARMDVEVPASEEPPSGPPPAEEGTSERDPLREGHEARTGKPPGETKEEKCARVQVHLEELYQEKLRMEAAGEAPKPPIDPPTSEQRISEAWASYESERDAARLRSREVGQGSARLDEARETEDLGFSAARMEIERADRRIGEVAVSSFQRYSMLSDELAASRLEVGQLSTQLAEEMAENQAWRSRIEVKEAEWEKRLQDMAAMVERLSATKVVDWTEQSRYSIQGEEVQGLFGQEGTTEPPQQGGMGKVFLDPIEAAARREAEEGRFSFRTPTELASQQATPMMIEIPEGEPAQGPQPPKGALTGAAASTEPEAMGGEASRLDELVAVMELDMPSGEPQRQKTSERVPEIGELRTQLGSWATGADLGEHISEQQQEVMSESVTVVTPQPSDLHRDEGATARGGVREGRPLRLDTPAYRPEGGEALAGPSTQMMEVGPAESWSMPQSHEMSKETSETPPRPGSQKKKRRCRGRSDDQCFFRKDGVHRALECLKFLKDKAAGRVTESGGRMYDRQGRVVERAPDGGRAQLYR
ncbi:hypothetical protein CBR_g39361 [Chara braunii]|uniref:Reverse transcriptase n=1 Tax=Chara braunii TaxID=69332 RepID=A0A388LRE3_CHABU|nr:hypothetical protein CBR_g39361 [Chara braunii]|eukprot:GBG84900.1 hypothetical protein CBR_g39361 [Chara braunii]